jgi:hypothetical protein
VPKCLWCHRSFKPKTLGRPALYCKRSHRQRAVEVRQGLRRPPRRGKTRLQTAWIWNDTITAFVRDRLHGYSLNVCAGRNPIASVNLDLDPHDRRVIKGDMRRLPFAPHSFDTVVSDPPWKIAFFDRHRPFYECVRVCKVGGRIVYNATWIPESTDATLDETWIRQDGRFMTVSVLSIFTKTQDNPDYEALIAKEQKAHKVKLHTAR